MPCTTTTDPAPIPANPSRKQQDELLKTHSGLVRKVARRFTPALEIDDAMQIARIAFVNSLPKYNASRGAFPGYVWFRMSAYLHTAVLHERRRSADSLDGPDITGEPRLDSVRTRFPLPDAVCESHERRSRLRTAIDTLPAMHRTVMTMRLRGGKTLRDVGEVVGRTAERVRQIEAESVGMLRDVLAGTD